MKIDEAQLDTLIKEVINKILDKSNSDISDKKISTIGKNNEPPRNPEYGIFESIESAIKAAKAAQLKLSFICLEKRKDIINAMREAVYENVQALAQLAVEETGMGRVKDKVQKNLLAARKTPGVEDITPAAFTRRSWIYFG